MTLEY